MRARGGVALIAVAWVLAVGPLLAGCAAGGGGAETEPASPPPPPMANGGPRGNGIVQTAYGFIAAEGDEPLGYGLYSYVLLPIPYAYDRNAALLRHVLGSTPAAEHVRIPRSRVNHLSVPVLNIVEARGLMANRTLGGERRIELFLQRHYSHDLAQGILTRFCGSHPRECPGDVTRGPYLLAYGSRPPVGGVPARFLLLDLSTIRQEAFGEFVAAFKAQVERDDFTDRERIATLRLGLLQIVLTAADWLAPVREGIAGIVHSDADSR